MRLRSFTGRTMSEAMAQVRQDLGPDAIILSTQEDADGGTCVTAALDAEGWPVPRAREAESDTIDAMSRALAAHGLAPELTEKILTAALPYDAEEPLVALSSALATLYSFKPLTATAARRVLLLTGPPGAGKTVTCAKLAARAVLGRGRVRLVGADAARAGANAQLAAFAKILRLPLHSVETADETARALAEARADELVLIDTQGVNPYGADDRAELERLIAASEAEPVLVLPAGGDPVDTIEMARVFRALGCLRLVVTRLDMVRRLGSIVAAADELGLCFSEAGTSPAIADGLTSFNPVVLARSLLFPSARPSPQRRGQP